MAGRPPATGGLLSPEAASTSAPASQRWSWVPAAFSPLLSFFFRLEGGAYFYDWLVGAALIAITAGVTGRVSPSAAVPAEQVLMGGAVRDPDKLLSYKSAETVPAGALYAIVWAGPAVPILAAQSWLRSWTDLHAAALSVFLAFAFAYTAKNFMNIGAGRLRPDW